MYIQKIKANENAYGRKRDYADIRYIVIHYTAGNGDTAQNEGLYYKNGNKRSAGAHFFVDQRGEIVKSVNINRVAWSVGGSKYNDCVKTGGGKYYKILVYAIPYTNGKYDENTKELMSDVKRADALSGTRGNTTFICQCHCQHRR